MQSEVGRQAHFLLWRVMVGVADSLAGLIRETVEPMGYELVGVEYLSQGKDGSLLRIYIDHADGIVMDDCVKVSHQVSGVLDVEDPIKENYRLEVSSPGLDRPLFTKEDFDRFTGSRVNIKLRVKHQGRRRFEGLLNGTLDDDVLVTVDDEKFTLPLEQIEKARLVPEL